MESPGNHCSICASSFRAEIENRLLAGLPLRDIAGQFAVSRSALSRHKRNCIATAMAAAGAVCDEITAERLVLELRQLRFVTLSVLDDARSAKDHGAALRAIARLEAQAELVGRLAGELVERHQVESIAVVVDAQWIALRSCILSVLADYPDALHAVVAALRDVDRVPA